MCVCAYTDEHVQFTCSLSYFEVRESLTAMCASTPVMKNGRGINFCENKWSKIILIYIYVFAHTHVMNYTYISAHTYVYIEMLGRFYTYIPQIACAESIRVCMAAHNNVHHIHDSIHAYKHMYIHTSDSICSINSGMYGSSEMTCFLYNRIPTVFHPADSGLWDL